ncbi:hypothetical protein ABZ553_07540 [Streptomyces sparsogenes]
MKAMALRRYGRGEDLEWTELPGPSRAVAPGEVLVRVQAAGANPVD